MTITHEGDFSVMWSHNDKDFTLCYYKIVHKDGTCLDGDCFLSRASAHEFIKKFILYTMNIIGKCLTVQEFKDYCAKKSFSPNNPNKIVIHHTWKPDVADWNGAKTISGLKRYYESLGWSAGPHLFIAEDGIWLFTDMNKQGIHAGEGNSNSIGIEVVGNYDGKVWKGKTRENALGAIQVLLDKLNLRFVDIKYHRQYSTKTCPGKMITAVWLKEKLREYNEPVTVPKPAIAQTPKSEPIVQPAPILEPIRAIREDIKVIETITDYSLPSEPISEPHKIIGSSETVKLSELLPMAEHYTIGKQDPHIVTDFEKREENLREIEKILSTDDKPLWKILLNIINKIIRK